MPLSSGSMFFVPEEKAVLVGKRHIDDTGLRENVR